LTKHKRQFQALQALITIGISVTFAGQKLYNMQVQHAIFNMGPMEITLVVLAILLLFGGKKIPELMRGIGQGIREFNSAKSNLKSERHERAKARKHASLRRNESLIFLPAPKNSNGWQSVGPLKTGITDGLYKCCLVHK
jgi:sec-independent protein translocase protein TatA